MSSSELEPTQWKILGDRLVDENPFIRLSIASVELPDGTKFEQYVMRMRRTATTVVLDEQDRVLLMWRHRFITDQWVWGLVLRCVVHAMVRSVQIVQQALSDRTDFLDGDGLAAHTKSRMGQRGRTFGCRIWHW